MTITIQPSFAKGEISPDAYGRVDISAYHVALKKARNVRIRMTGGAENRPGSMFIGPVKDHTYTPRLIDFEFKTEDTYILEMGDRYIRFIRNQGYILEEPNTISSYTTTSPAVFTTGSPHEYVDGEEVYVSDIQNSEGDSRINNRRWIVKNPTASTFELANQVTGDLLDFSSEPDYIGGGDVAAVYELSTPYSIDDVWDIKHVQNADIMTLVHRDYDVYDLKRFGNTQWELVPASFEPEQVGPTDVSVTVNTPETTTERYKVTAINADSIEESLSGTVAASVVITAITNANPAEITSTAHGVTEGDQIYISDVLGMVELNDRNFIASNVTTDTLELLEEDSTTYAPYVSDGVMFPTYFEVTDSHDTITDNTITWTAASGSNRYAVYRRENGLYGWLGETEELTFHDENIDPDMALAPPTFRNPFKSPGNYPGAVSFFEQRKVFGGTYNKPDTTFYSQTGNVTNFSKSQPLQQDDAIEATLTSRKVNEIRHFVPGTDLMVFTSGSEWRVNSGGDSAFAFDTIRQRNQSYWGSAQIEPIVAGQIVLYISHEQLQIRSFAYNLQSDSYVGDDMNLLSSHLFENLQVTDWAYAHSPFSLIYTVREDGKMPMLTFNEQQEVVAWTVAETDGEYEAVGISSGTADEHLFDEVYTVVKREVDGNTVRYVELFDDRRFATVEDAFFVDSGLTYRGDPTSTITGLWHLEGKEVVANADGNAQNPRTVVNGSVQFTDEYSVIHVGLPYMSYIQTLNIETPRGTIQGRKKNIPEVTVRLKRTRGLLIGPDLEHLDEWYQRSNEAMGDPTSLFTGDVPMKISADWNLDGTYVLATPYPLPWTVLAIMPNVYIDEAEDG